MNESIGYGMRLNSEVDGRIKVALRSAEILIATTETVRNEYREIGVDMNRVSMVPNGVNLKRFAEFRERRLSIRKKLGISESEIIVLSTGRFHPKKNFEQIIDSANLVVEKYGEDCLIRFVLVGRGVGGLRERLNQSPGREIVSLIEPGGVDDSEGVEEVVDFPDRELLEWYSASDLFVMPSILESFGIVTVEAMAMGLPVIAANAPGNIDILGGGEFGILYNGKVEALVESIQRVLDSRDLRLRLSRASMERSASFDWSEVVDRYIDLYNRRM